tara:strand:+ start:1046 stop:1651 length:606 start_codon:yes stop_codon:yes gene_type:complete
MKIIAVSQRLEKSKYGELRAQLDSNLLNFVYKSGYIPVPIPYFIYNKKKSLKCLSLWIKKIKPDGFILSGGDDIGKFKIRDWSELFILSFAKRKRIRLLGICRGMQLIAKKHGSRLIKVKNHVNKNHFIIMNKKKIKVNSYHNMALDNCPKNFQITSIAEDGVIESIKSNYYKIEGWMWHPERYKSFKNFDIKSFKRLFSE